MSADLTLDYVLATLLADDLAAQDRAELRERPTLPAPSHAEEAS